MDEQSNAFRLNGGRFYQQARTVKKRRYGPYWYCRSGWGKVTHLGAELPPDIIAGQQAQAHASALLRHLDSLSSTLRRFVRGDVMTAPVYCLPCSAPPSLPTSCPFPHSKCKAFPII